MDLAHQHLNVECGIEQLVSGPFHFQHARLFRQAVLVNQFRDAELGWSQGSDKAGVGDERQTFPWFGVLDLIEKNRCHQHRVHLLQPALPQDHGLELAKLRKGVVPDRFNPVHPPGHQLGQLVLGAMHSETTLQLLEFGGGELKRICRGISRTG
ncbi:MAG: Uncharacterised protein [Synechococcus sp. CC9902]|nr:MAG: Uncharacterised protein [Synechococcus sp. CC9902]